ncbi:hypothetical protein TIFTF001_012238 [Ficus carica]|uniref:Uncharacterized protein n=1 Tax=Ficus carica TaxID=3494 RepID=A0AA88AN04_FICCA|nr:hypothetical protein TIFTF001_012238 [Ficus carica]
MSKISDTIPDVVVRLGRFCTVALHLVTCEKEALRSDGDTNGVSMKGTPMLKLVIVLVSKRRSRVLARKNCPYLNRYADPLFIDVLREFRCSGDPIGLNSECSRRVDTLQCQSKQAADIGDVIGAITSGMSSVKLRIVSVVPGHCRQPVRGSVTQTVGGPQNKWRSPVVKEDISGSMVRDPTIHYPGYAVGAPIQWACGRSTTLPGKNMDPIGSDPVWSNRSTP